MRRFLNNERGSATAEYALVIAMVAAMTITITSKMTHVIEHQFETASAILGQQ